MTQTVINPTTGKTLHEFPVMDPAQRDAVLERSDVAYRDWRKTSFSERADLLRRVAEVMREAITTVEPEATLEEIDSSLDHHSAVLVGGGQTVGIITEADVAARL